MKKKLTYEEAEIGMKVKLINSRHGISENNPVISTDYECIGTIIKIDAQCDNTLPISVKWLNQNSNTYSVSDLRLIGRTSNLKCRDLWA